MPAMTFEKAPSDKCPYCFGPMPCAQHTAYALILEHEAVIEHPAARAARMVKEIHEETIKLIDSGAKLTKDDVPVQDEIREACLLQVKQCDDIIARIAADDTLDAVRAETSKDELPEIGNYDHKA